MRGISSRLIIVALTFDLGITAASFTGLLPKAEKILAKVLPHLIFIPSDRGCGCGTTQGYSLLDGRYMSESSSGICYKTPQIAQEKLQSIVANALKVIERIPKYKNRFGSDGERIVLLYLNKEGKERVKILWYDGDKLITEIDAPTLEVAMGFESANAYLY